MNVNKRRIGAYLKGSGKEPEDSGVGAPKSDGGPVEPSNRKNAPPAARSDAVPPQKSAAQAEKARVTPPKTAKTNSAAAPLTPQALIKTTKSRVPGKPSRSEIAKYLILIGHDEASSILRHLSPSEVEALAKEIASIPSIGPDEGKEILERFSGLVATSNGASGGVDAARNILVDAFGEDKGSALLKKAVPDLEEPYFNFMKDIEPAQATQLLKGESLGVKGIVLAYIAPAQAAAILKDLPLEEQKDLVIRLSRMKKIEKEVLVRIHEALKEKLANVGVLHSEDLDGTGNLASIMRHLDPALEQRLLESLQEEAPDVVEKIKDRLFTVDTILLIDDKDMQKVLQALDNLQIALILKGKSDELKQKFLSNVSENRAVAIADEFRNLGPKPRKEVEEATRDLINKLRRLEQEGKIVVHRDGEEYI